MPLAKRRPPADPDDAAAAEAAALRILSAAAQSGQSLQRRLLQRGFSAAAAAEAVRRCRELGYVDDAALADSVAARHRRSSHGRARILADLRHRGVDDGTIANIAETLAADEQDAAVMAAQQLRRRLGGDGGIDANARQRIGAALQRRGFAGDVIVRALRTLE